jgi:hypothetical protein
MSAGPAPPNPGSSAPKRKGPKPPATSQLARLGPQILLGGVAIGAAYAFFATRAPAPQGSSQGFNPLRTPGVKNVEKAYANGGGTTTYQPAYGGSTQGSKGADGLRPGGATGLKDGMGSEHIGELQRPVQPGIIGEKFHEMTYGSKSGK